MRARLRDIEAQIESTQSSIAERNADISKLDTDRKAWKLQSFPMAMIEKSGRYFGRPSIVAYAYGIQVQRKFPRRLLSYGAFSFQPNSSEIKRMYTDKGETFKLEWLALRDMVDSARDTKRRFSELVGSLTAEKAKVEQGLNDLKEEPEPKLKPWQETAAKSFSADQAVARVLDEMQSILAERLEDAKQFLALSVEPNCEVLWHLNALLDAAIQEVQTL